MLKTKCIHPEILNILASCGHGDKVLICDGNFALDSNVSISTKKVYLNLSPGLMLVPDVLSVLKDTIAIEKVEVMVPASGEEPVIFKDFQQILGMEHQLVSLTKPDFYEECKKEKVKLGIETGDLRTFGNILLTIGVVKNLPS